MIVILVTGIKCDEFTLLFIILAVSLLVKEDKFFDRV